MNTCYEEIDYIESFFNNKTMRELLGITHDRPFSSHNATVQAKFLASGDWTASPIPYYVAGLLERGVRVLIYAGTYDWVCNWVSNMMWLEILEWSGQAAYNRESWRIWGIDSIDPKVHEWVASDGTIVEQNRKRSGGAGIMKRAGPLAFASIWEAGHFMSSFYFAAWLCAYLAS
jgi:carboxypeptidase C (cathepsin A)